MKTEKQKNLALPAEFIDVDLMSLLTAMFLEKFVEFYWYSWPVTRIIVVSNHVDLNL